MTDLLTADGDKKAPLPPPGQELISAWRDITPPIQVLAPLYFPGYRLIPFRFIMLIVRDKIAQRRRLSKPARPQTLGLATFFIHSTLPSPGLVHVPVPVPVHGCVWYVRSASFPYSVCTFGIRLVKSTS